MQLKRKQFLELDLYGLTEVANEKKESLSTSSSNSDIPKSPSYKRLLRVSTDEKDLVPAASTFDDKLVEQKENDNINVDNDQVAESKENIDIDQLPGVTRVDSKEEVVEVKTSSTTATITTIEENNKEFEEEMVYVKYDVLSNRQFIDGFSHGEYYKAKIIAKKPGDCVDVLYDVSQLVEENVAMEYIKRIESVN